MLVRREIIHIKHIFTELFQRRTIPNYQLIFDSIGIDLFGYMKIMTRVIRKIHLFDRSYRQDINRITKEDKNSFFKQVELYKGLNNIIALDFDGTITSKKFYELYKLCCQRCKVFVVTANPTVEEGWFLKHDLPSPDRIYACKGKVRKIRKLIALQEKFDQVFYVDNEKSYLEVAWMFGIKTFKYERGKIKYYTLKTK